MQFTRRDADLYVTVLGNPTGQVTVEGIELRGPAELLGSDGPATVETHGGNTVLTAGFSGGFAPVVRIAGATE